MKSRTMIIIVACLLLGAAAQAGSFAGAMVVIVGAALFWQGHTIEVKLNRLLDHHRLVVTKDDIDA